MKLIKQFLLAASLALAAGSANATVYDLGSIGTAPVIKNVSVTGIFTDTFNFSFATDSAFASTLTPVKLSMFGMDILNITGLSIQLFDSTNNLQGSGTTSISFADLESGVYHAIVAGTATGLAGGNYTFSAIAQPVPEPSAWIMMLAGLGLITFMSYRRRVF